MDCNVTVYTEICRLYLVSCTAQQPRQSYNKLCGFATVSATPPGGDASDEREWTGENPSGDEEASKKRRDNERLEV